MQYFVEYTILFGLLLYKKEDGRWYEWRGRWRYMKYINPDASGIQPHKDFREIDAEHARFLIALPYTNHIYEMVGITDKQVKDAEEDQKKIDDMMDVIEKYEKI